MAICTHDKSAAEVHIVPMRKGALDGPIIGYMAVVNCTCRECGINFRFKGAPVGLYADVATVSANGLEFHIPMEPNIVTELDGHAQTVGNA